MSPASAKIVRGVIVGAAAAVVLVSYAAPAHTPLGSVWRVLPVGIAIDCLLAIGLIYTAVVLRRAGERQAFIVPLVAGIPMLIFTPSFGNALNVLFDSSAPARREMEIVDTRTVGSRAPGTFFVFEAWRGSAETVLIPQSQVKTPGGGWRRGDKYFLTTHAGAFGRPYVREVERAPLPRDELVKRFSFSMSPAEVASLFDVKGGGAFNVKFEHPGILSEARFERRGAVALFGGENLDVEAAGRRLQGIAPLTPNGRNRERRVGGIVLAFHEHTFGPRRGFFGVRVDSPGDARAADAVWATVLYAIYGSPEPTAEQRRIVSGGE